MTELAYIDIKIDRDSVHPADDIYSHDKIVQFPVSGTIVEFLQLVNQPPYLPAILGDQATWIVDLLGSWGELSRGGCPAMAVAQAGHPCRYAHHQPDQITGLLFLFPLLVSG